MYDKKIKVHMSNILNASVGYPYVGFNFFPLTAAAWCAYERKFILFFPVHPLIHLHINVHPLN